MASALTISQGILPLRPQRPATVSSVGRPRHTCLMLRHTRTAAHAQEVKNSDGLASSSTPEAQPAAPAAASNSSAAPAGDAAEPESHPLQLSAQELLTELTDEQQLGKRGELWFLAQVVTFVLILFPPFSLEGLVNLVATLLLTAGLVFMSYALASLGRNLSPLPAPRRKHELVTSGMYSYVRHPMYAGLLMVGIGLAAITRNECRLALTVLLWVVLEQKVSYEEKALLDRYPNYKDYMAKVKKFIPFVY